jgi:hypothetical protein
MAKFSRFDPRNKKNGRNKKITLGEYPNANKKNAMDMDEDKYLWIWMKISTFVNTKRLSIMMTLMRNLLDDYSWKDLGLYRTD